MQRKTNTLGRDGPSSSEESQRSINKDFAIGTKNFKLWETKLGSSFIMTLFTAMFATNVVMLGVKKIS